MTKNNSHYATQGHSRSPVGKPVRHLLLVNNSYILFGNAVHRCIWHDSLRISDVSMRRLRLTDAATFVRYVRLSHSHNAFGDWCFVSLHRACALRYGLWKSLRSKPRQCASHGEFKQLLKTRTPVWGPRRFVTFLVQSAV